MKRLLSCSLCLVLVLLTGLANLSSIIAEPEEEGLAYKGLAAAPSADASRRSPKEIKEESLVYEKAGVPFSAFSGRKARDFINPVWQASGNLDPRSKEKGSQLPDSNWFVPASVTEYISYYFHYDGSPVLARHEEEFLSEPARQKQARAWFKGPAGEARLDAAKEARGEILEQQGVQGSFRYGDLVMLAESMTMEEPMPVAPRTDGGGGEDYSETNVQVEGVDEGNVIKTDGEYIYYLHPEKGVAIIRAGRSPVQEAVLKNSQFLAYTEMYLDGDNLVLVGEANLFQKESEGEEVERVATLFVTYDVSQPSQPRETRRILVPGELLESRYTGGRLTFATQDWCDLMNYGSAVSYGLPLYGDSLLGDEEALRTLPPEKCRLWTGGRCQWQTYLGSFAPGEKEALSLQMLAAPIDTLYINQDTLIMAGYDAAGNYGGEQGLFVSGAYTPPRQDNGKVTTWLFSFAWEGDGFTYEKTGSVPGDLLNRYALDVYGDTVRVMTTGGYSKPNPEAANYVPPKSEELLPDADGSYPIPEAPPDDFIWQYESRLFILDAKTLEAIGELRGIGAGEDLKSVRYRGDTAYAVTFRNIDPLFVLDLSDPKKPAVAGELKIPGFSTYLHPIGLGRVLGLGYEVDEEWGVTLGLKLSLFDVSDPKKPAELDKLIIPGTYTDSLAIYDPRAMLFDGPRGILAFPLHYSNDLEWEEPEDETEARYAAVLEETSRGWSKGNWVGGVVLGFDDEGLTLEKALPLYKGEDDEELWERAVNGRFLRIGKELYFADGQGLTVLDYDDFTKVASLSLSYRSNNN